MGGYGAGTSNSVGLIPPGATDVYSSTICQIKVNEELAPDGLKVFAYVPHMHLLGRRMWTDHLVDPTFRNGTSGFVTDLDELVKVQWS